MIDQAYLIQRLAEIEAEENAPRPSASMDCRHDDWGDGNGSYWGRLRAEKQRLLERMGALKPEKYLTSGERFAKYGKSPIMLAQEAAAKALMDD